MRIMWLFLCLYHKPQSFQLAAVFGAGSYKIDSGGIDTAVSQNIRKLRDILLNAVEGPGKELAKIVREYLTFLNTGCTA